MLSVDPLLSPTQERPGPGVLDLFADFEGVLGGFGSVVTGDAGYLESKRQRSSYDQATTYFLHCSLVIQRLHQYGLAGQAS